MYAYINKNLYLIACSNRYPQSAGQFIIIIYVVRILQDHTDLLDAGQTKEQVV